MNTASKYFPLKKRKVYMGRIPKFDSDKRERKRGYNTYMHCADYSAVEGKNAYLCIVMNKNKEMWRARRGETNLSLSYTIPHNIPSP
jgi:hypothetical protein